MNLRNLSKLRNSLGAALLVSGAMALPSACEAATVVLNDGNSQASVNLDSSAGMYNWSVDGQNQLNQQWFWYRVGAGSQAPVNNISLSSIMYNDASTLVANYANAQLSLDITYVLTGGLSGSGTADILESITVNNLTASPLDFHFFQYSDFNLLANPSGDSVVIGGSPGPGFDFVFQSKGPTQIQEAITSPVANRAEAGLYSSTLTSLGTPGYNLNNVASAGPGNVTWALQWDVSIPVEGSFVIFKDKLLSIEGIPEPSTLAIIGLGLGVLGLARRRQ